MSDRKYRHRGYQDSEWEERERQRQRSSEGRDKSLAPGRRGLGAPTLSVFRCRVCGEKLALNFPVPLEASCPRCKTPLHSCAHCSYFDVTAPNECLKPVLTRISNKNSANACQLFSPRLVQEFAEEAPSDPRAAFHALFRKN